MFRHTVEMVQSGLRSPANIERTRDMRTCPVEDCGHFSPIRHVLEWHLLHRGARNYHSVELLLTQFIKVFIKHHHVFYGRILRSVALQLHEIHFHLQGRIRRSEEHTSELQSRQYLVCRLLLEKKKNQ